MVCCTISALATLSLCLMPCLCARCLGSWAAPKHDNIIPSDVRVTGAEAPSDTDQFARALGLPSRSHLAGNSAPGSFNLFLKGLHRCDQRAVRGRLGGIPHESNMFVWHSWSTISSTFTRNSRIKSIRLRPQRFRTMDSGNS